MRKFILIAALILALALISIYYFGFQTYFIEDQVNEELPQMTPNGQELTSKEPKIIKQGNFIDSDFFHKGSGQAYILEYPGGRKILRFENFETTNGPDLYVYLSSSAAPTGNLKSLGEFIDLGQLKGNIGDQNYELPQNASINDLNSVIIWCKKFGALFPYSVLK